MHCSTPTSLILTAVVGVLTLQAQVELEDAVVTATPEPRSARTLPVPVTVIDREAIEASYAFDIPDLLRGVGGLEVVDSTGSGRRTQVDMRGFGETSAANLAIVVDGRPVNETTLAGVDWTTIPLDRVQRIEIVRGGGAVMYGDNATAGVIHIITRPQTANAETPTQVQLETRAGEYRDWRHSFSAYGGDARLTWNLDATVSDFDGYRDNSDVYYESVGASVELGVNEVLRLRLDAGWKDDAYGLPGALEPNAPPRTTTHPDDRVETHDAYVSVTPLLELGESLSLKLPIHYRELFSKTDTPSFQFQYQIQQIDFRPSASFDLDLLDHTHRLTMGADVRRGELDEAVNSEPAIREEIAVWLKDAIPLRANRLFLDLGLRLGTVAYDYESLEDSDHDVVAASAGLTYAYADESKAFVSVQQGYRTQLLDELNYPPPTYGAIHPALTPQTSITLQTGLQHAFCERFSAGITAFVIETENEIFFDPLTFTNSSYEQTQRRGVELEARANPHKTLALSAALTVQESKLKGGAYDGNPVPGTTPIGARLAANWHPCDRFSVTGRLRWTKDRTLISDWAETSPHWNDTFTVVDLTSSWKVNEAISFYIGCNNVFDESYAEYAILAGSDDAFQVYPSPERELFAGIRLKQAF